MHQFNEEAGNQKWAKTNGETKKTWLKRQTNYQLRNICFMCAIQFVNGKIHLLYHRIYSTVYSALISALNRTHRSIQRFHFFFEIFYIIWRKKKTKLNDIRRESSKFEHNACLDHWRHSSLVAHTQIEIATIYRWMSEELYFIHDMIWRFHSFL